MESNRQIIGKALLSAFLVFVAAGVPLVAAGDLVLGVALVLAGVVGLVAGMSLILQRPRKLVLSPDVARAFARAGSFFGEPPRYESSLRRKR